LISHLNLLWSETHCSLSTKDFFFLLHKDAAGTATTHQTVFDLVAFEGECVSDFAALDYLVAESR
jgi:hypothetical protein